MPTSSIPFQLLAGESRTYRLTVVDAAGLAVDLTGASIEFEVRRSIGAPDPAVMTKTLGAGITLLAQAGLTMGQADLEILPADTESLVGTYIYDVVVTSGGRRQYVVPPSAFSIQQAVNVS